MQTTWKERERDLERKLDWINCANSFSGHRLAQTGMCDNGKKVERNQCVIEIIMSFVSFQISMFDETIHAFSFFVLCLHNLEKYSSFSS